MVAIRRFGGQALIVFDNVFIAHGYVLMDGEREFAQGLVARVTARSAALCASIRTEKRMIVVSIGRDYLDVISQCRQASRHVRHFS
jgi:hypothetical protein